MNKFNKALLGVLMFGLPATAAIVSGITGFTIGVVLGISFCFVSAGTYIISPSQKRTEQQNNQNDKTVIYPMDLENSNDKYKSDEKMVQNTYKTLEESNQIGTFYSNMNINKKQTKGDMERW